MTGSAPSVITSSVMMHDSACFHEGSSYMMFSMASSMTERRPRAPDLRSEAIRATACKAAGVPQWSPHRLRHSAATELRKRYGLDTARVILGHACPQITDMYAQLDAEQAIDAIAEIG